MTRDGATFPDIEPEIDQLLHPSRFYARPTDVVADQLLTVDERRAILSSWASDACAVESNPALRQPPHAKAPVTFDEIMDALMQLDRLKGFSTGPQWPGSEPSVLVGTSSRCRSARPVGN